MAVLRSIRRPAASASGTGGAGVWSKRDDKPISAFYLTSLLHFPGYCLKLTEMAPAAKSILAQRNVAVVSVNSVAVGIIRIGIRPHGPA